MARIKGGANAKKKHNKTLKAAKGYIGARSKQYRVREISVSFGSLVSTLQLDRMISHTATLCMVLR